MAIGFDMGTYNLVCCKRDKDNNFENKREINAFIEIPLNNRFVFNMLKKSGVPLIERKDANVAYALGEAAVQMAYAMPNIELKRAMKDGCLNPKERSAQQIMSIMVHSLIGEVKSDEPLYYCIPANAINQETDSDYHQKVLQAIFNAFKDDKGNKVRAMPINEALALVYAEFENKAWTGIGVSFGAGMVNVCYSIYSSPVFQFSIVNSGDWIDKMASKATGESEIYINQEKLKLDLSKSQDNLVQRAIATQYEIMIQKTITEIKKGIEMSGSRGNSKDPVDVVIAGGTSSPNGFEKLFETSLRAAQLPIQIGNVSKPKDTLFSVARGCLIAAENSGL